MVEETRVPAFCGRCGSKLRANEDVTGYDVYTGEPETSRELYCSNPTVVRSTRLGVLPTTETTFHPSWSQNADGTWVQN